MKIATIGYGSTTPKERIVCFNPVPGSQAYRINLDIPVKSRLIYPHPLDSENRACVAVGRGPFIYSAETVDNPTIDDLRRLRIPNDVQFTEVQIKLSQDTDAIVALRGTVRVVVLPDGPGITAQTGRIDSDGPGGEWVVLGRGVVTVHTAPTEEERQADVTLVPFFGWANRGKSDVRVWLPRSSQQRGDNKPSVI
ncbi:glycoside hydrolase family 127 protein [Ramaria rubella]|nr:glycoside hydrolase family 127 protein [Ramaria rubella]